MDDKPNPYASPQSDFAAAGEAWMRDQTGQLRLVYIGLSLSYWGIILTLLGVMIAIGSAFLAASAGPAVALALMIGGAGMAVIGSLLSFVGPFFCLAVPAESGAKGFIIASVALQLVNFIVSPIAAFVEVPAMYELVSNLAGPLAALAALFAFILFMRRLAAFIGQPQLLARADRVLVGAGLIIVSWIITVVAVAAVGFFVAIAVLVVFIMYANLINDLRKQVKQRGERGA